MFAIKVEKVVQGKLAPRAFLLASQPMRKTGTAQI
jgi:hypothetical protein